MTPTEIDQLIRVHYEAAYRYAWYLCRSDAEDILQDSLISLWKGATRLRDPSKFQAYLKAIIRTKSLNLKTRDEWRGVLLSDEKIMVLADTRNQDEELKSALIAALESLDEFKRSLLILHDVDEITVPFLSKATGKSQTHIRVLLFRTRKELRHLIKEYIKIGHMEPSVTTVADLNDTNGDSTTTYGKLQRTLLALNPVRRRNTKT